MFRDLGAVCVLLLCAFSLKVHAGCPFGMNMNLPSASNVLSHKTEEEVTKEKLRKFITLTDKDLDSKTSVEELTAWTQKSLRSAYKQEAEARAKALDKNKDGKITWEEYQQSKEDIGATTEEQKRRRFNQADEDKKGWLTSDEIISMFHPEEKPHMFDVVVDEYLEMADSDKDGSLTWDEYKNKMVKSGKGQQKVAKQFFEQLDKDQDGRITREEIKLWLESVNTVSLGKKQAQLVIDQADDNKDGFLTEREILNHVNLFTGESKGQQTAKETAKDEL